MGGLIRVAVYLERDLYDILASTGNISGKAKDIIREHFHELIQKPIPDQIKEQEANVQTALKELDRLRQIKETIERQHIEQAQLKAESDIKGIEIFKRNSMIRSEFARFDIEKELADQLIEDYIIELSIDESYSVERFMQERNIKRVE